MTATAKKSVKAKKKAPAKVGRKPSRKPNQCRDCVNPRWKDPDTGKLNTRCKTCVEKNRVYMKSYMANVRKGKKKGERSPLPKSRQQKHKIVKKAAKPKKAKTA